MQFTCFIYTLDTSVIVYVEQKWARKGKKRVIFFLVWRFLMLWKSPYFRVAKIKAKILSWLGELKFCLSKHNSSHCGKSEIVFKGSKLYTFIFFWNVPNCLNVYIKCLYRCRFEIYLRWFSQMLFFSLSSFFIKECFEPFFVQKILLPEPHKMGQCKSHLKMEGKRFWAIC